MISPDPLISSSLYIKESIRKLPTIESIEFIILSDENSSDNESNENYEIDSKTIDCDDI